MNSERISDAGYEELRRKLAVAEVLHTVGRRAIGTFKEVLCEEYDIDSMHIAVHRCDPLDHDTHEHSLYWFEIKDQLADPPLNMHVSVTLDGGTPFIQHVFADGKESELRMHLEVIERIAEKLAEHVRSLKPTIDTVAIHEQIRNMVDQ